MELINTKQVTLKYDERQVERGEVVYEDFDHDSLTIRFATFTDKGNSEPRANTHSVTDKEMLIRFYNIPNVDGELLMHKPLLVAHSDDRKHKLYIRCAIKPRISGQRIIEVSFYNETV